MYVQARYSVGLVDVAELSTASFKGLDKSNSTCETTFQEVWLLMHRKPTLTRVDETPLSGAW